MENGENGFDPKIFDSIVKLSLSQLVDSLDTLLVIYKLIVLGLHIS